MLYERYKSTRFSLSGLSGSDDVGSYDFYTTIVAIDNISSEYLERLPPPKERFFEDGGEKYMPMDVFEKFRKHLPVAVHELTHFVDATSTLWGVKYLELMANAYKSNTKRFGAREKDYIHAKKFYDLLKFSKLPSYFTEKIDGPDISAPWTVEESIGKRFNSDGTVGDLPILFNWFLNSQRKPIVRSPISILSLLECSAMAQEVTQEADLIMSLSENDQIIEKKLYEKKIHEYIFDKDLTEYSVCMHLMARSVKSTGLFIDFLNCARLLRVVLNFPSSLYEKLSKNLAINIIFNHPPIPGIEYLDSIRKGLSSNEPGFLFYLMCKALSLTESKKEFDSRLIDAFSLIDIELEDVISESNREFESTYRSLLKIGHGNINLIANAGYINYHRIKWNNPILNLNELNIPPVLLNDGKSYNLFESDDNILKNLDVDTLYEELVSGQIWVENFSNACG